MMDQILSIIDKNPSKLGNSIFSLRNPINSFILFITFCKTPIILPITVPNKFVSFALSLKPLSHLPNELAAFKALPPRPVKLLISWPIPTTISLMNIIPMSITENTPLKTALT